MDIEEIRRRVELKRQAQEKEQLRRELYGQDKPADPDAVYLSSKEAAKDLGISVYALQYQIKTGRLKARKASRRRGCIWAIHPDDFKEFKSLYYPNIR